MSNDTQNLILIGMLVAIVLYAVFVVWYLVARRRKPRRERRPDTQKYIVVDGSNVMYWGGEPSVLVLVRALDFLKQNGFAPIVYFDANVGYKLWGRHVNAQEMAAQLVLDIRHVIVVPKGVTADEILLQTALENGLRVVTNDRFMDWREQFSGIGKKGFLVKGTWQEGRIVLRGL